MAWISESRKPTFVNNFMEICRNCLVEEKLVHFGHCLVVSRDVVPYASKTVTHSNASVTVMDDVLALHIPESIDQRCDVFSFVILKDLTKDLTLDCDFLYSPDPESLLI